VIFLISSLEQEKTLGEEILRREPVGLLSVKNSSPRVFFGSWQRNSSPRVLFFAENIVFYSR
jgi:hypothetical protein